MQYNAPSRELFINRELSWLEFNRRVLALTKSPHVPLGERLNFASIYVSNLDEFFMIRMGSLYDQTLLKSVKTENKTGMTPQQQIDAILPKVEQLQKLCDRNVAALLAHLDDIGYKKVELSKLTKHELQYWKHIFLKELYPLLSPQIIGRRHPFPFLRNLEIYVGALLKEGKSDSAVFGLIPVSSQFNRMITKTSDNVTSYVLVEQLILHFADIAFGNVEVQSKCLFRVTRNADINVEEGMFDHDIDYRVIMGELLKKRRKQAAVRLQFYNSAPEGIQQYLLQKLLLPEKQVNIQKCPLELSFMRDMRHALRKTDESAYFYPPVRSLVPPAGFSLYQAVNREDVMLYYPYHSIKQFVAMLYQAARDPSVISIKMTLYRVASDSDVIKALIAAAENGKEVVTVVELRARFDEENNIEWSKRLENAGCTVIYGFSDFKVHSKLTLITRSSQKGIEYISAIGTGNYNEKTSELYTDIVYLTAKQAIGEEVAAVFNDLAVERLTTHSSQLIVAPLQFKSVLLRELETEVAYQAEGGEGSVVLKCNSISDKMVIETLCKTSQAGVRVDMIVRGICCLQSGIPGLTDSIRVTSIIGRYLEHARIYAFGRGERARVYIASGDFLTRNTERRVEVGVRIEDREMKETLFAVLDMQLADTVNASQMRPNGSYVKVKPLEGQPLCDSQMDMYAYLEQRGRYLDTRHLACQKTTKQQRKSASSQADASAGRKGGRSWLRRLIGRK